MEPEIVLTEISQTKKDKCHMFSLMRSRYTLYVNRSRTTGGKPQEGAGEGNRCMNTV